MVCCVVPTQKYIVKVAGASVNVFKNVRVPLVKVASWIFIVGLLVSLLADLSETIKGVNSKFNCKIAKKGLAPISTHKDKC